MYSNEEPDLIYLRKHNCISMRTITSYRQIKTQSFSRDVCLLTKILRIEKSCFRTDTPNTGAC